MPPGLYTVVSGSGRQNAERQQQGLRAHDVLFLLPRQKQALGKLFMHRSPQSGAGDWRCHTARSCDTLKKQANMHSPQDIVKLPFYLHGGTRTKAPRARGCSWLPHGLVRPGHTHWIRCGGRDHISQLLRSYTEHSRSTLQTPPLPPRPAPLSDVPGWGLFSLGCGPPQGSAPRVMGPDLTQGPLLLASLFHLEKMGHNFGRQADV